MAKPHSPKKTKKNTQSSPPKNENTSIKKGPIFGLDILMDSSPMKSSKKAQTRPAARNKNERPAARKKSAGKVPAAPLTTIERNLPDCTWDPASFTVSPEKDRVRFHDFQLAPHIMQGLSDIHFEYCTPIQAEVLQHTLSGRDATGRAQTGTGKTAAFLLTIFNCLLADKTAIKWKTGTPRALIIAPTRELVLQIVSDGIELGKHTGLNILAVYGGVDYEKQQKALTENIVDIVVATPGRLLDFQRRQNIDLSKVSIFVIDEADRMLDMGFIPDVRQIVYSLPPKTKRQTLLFSATLTPDVNHLASQWTKDPITVEIEPAQVTVDTVKEIVYMVTSKEKFALVYNLVSRKNIDRVIVFANRRDETRKLTDLLKRCKINCAMLSGEVPQQKRTKTLADFKAGKIRVLVATDVAGRGIHVDKISHVINFNLPYDPEDYVHRIGRTGRAGESGISISFACEEDSFYLPDIEEYIGHKLECVYPDEELVQMPKIPKQENPRYPRPKHRAAGKKNFRAGHQRHSRKPAVKTIKKNDSAED